MRIAIAGTHYSGKTTLAGRLAEVSPGYVVVDEPYHSMVEDGFEFEEPPSVEEFFAQLQVSHAAIAESSERTLFDRSPLDFLAYALCVSAGSVDLEDWTDHCAEALVGLDAIIFCPIEEPDRIAAPSEADRRLRRRVDKKLQRLVLDDDLGLLTDIRVLEVRGTLEQRVAQSRTLLDDGGS